MKSLVGVFISIFGFIATFIILVMVIRLSIGQTPFVSISQIYHSISDIDLLIHSLQCSIIVLNDLNKSISLIE